MPWTVSRIPKLSSNHADREALRCSKGKMKSFILKPFLFVYKQQWWEHNLWRVYIFTFDCKTTKTTWKTCVSIRQESLERDSNAHDESHIMFIKFFRKVFFLNSVSWFSLLVCSVCHCSSVMMWFEFVSVIVSLKESLLRQRRGKHERWLNIESSLMSQTYKKMMHEESIDVSLDVYEETWSWEKWQYRLTQEEDWSEGDKWWSLDDRLQLHFSCHETIRKVREEETSEEIGSRM